MPTREAIQGLAEEIVRSYEDRINGIARVKGSEAERQRTAAQEIAQRRSDVGAIRSDVGAMLKGFDDAHAAMSQELRAALRGSEVERKSGVSAMLRGLRKEQAGARDEWQKLTATLQAKRGMPVVEVRPPEAVAPPPVQEVAVAPEVTPELPDLRSRVFAYLADRPDGTKLAELEQEFGVGRFQMSRVIQGLMDDNKAEKRELLYFAI